jgi:creatinine amidohydrolase
MAIADAASHQTKVLVAPAVNFGASPYFLAYPGTISLRIATLMDLVEDLVSSLYGQGFRRFLFLNGHGGNESVRSRLYELTNRLANIRVVWYAWWRSHAVENILLEKDLKSYHGGWIEAFPFTRVSPLPDGEKTSSHIPGLLNAEEARKIYKDGVFGGTYQQDEAILEEIFQAAVDDVVAYLAFE